MATVVELREKHFETATPESIGIVVGEQNAATTKALESLNAYLKAFISQTNCPGCDSPIGGILGSFRWGICSGEGYCNQCGYLMRAVHKIKDFGTISNLILPYHPDILEEKEGR